MTNRQHTPDAILHTAFSFWGSKVLLTAVEFGVFTRLANRRLTGAELELHPRHASEVIHLAGPSSAAVAYR